MEEIGHNHARVRMPSRPHLCIAALAGCCLAMGNLGAGVLGTAEARAEDMARVDPAPIMTAVPTGTWGGPHMRLDLTTTAGKVEFDCAFGTIDEPLRVDEAGSFEAHGTHALELGGATRAGDPPIKGRPAIYRGRVEGEEMRVTVTVPATGHEVGTFELRLGHVPHLEKCL